MSGRPGPYTTKLRLVRVTAQVTRTARTARTVDTWIRVGHVQHMNFAVVEQLTRDEA
jgi:hypothetical protein